MTKILIVEDDADTQQLTSKKIEGMGLIAFISPNGKHAYETLRVNQDIRLLITDIMMPEMDGKQLIQILRGDYQLRDLPIIIMSSVVGLKEISHLLKMGATLFLRKPVVPSELGEAITKCLKEQG